MLVILFFSHNVSKPSQNKFQVYFHIYFVVCICFNLDQSKLLSFGNELTHSHTMTHFDAPGKQAFRKHCVKRRNCLLQAISPFPPVFSNLLGNFLPILSNLKMSSANSFSLEESKICRLVKRSVKRFILSSAYALIWTSLNFCCLVKN